MSLSLFFAWIAVSWLALALPGPDFFLVSTISFRKKRYGMWCGLGIEVGVMIHMTITMLGSITLLRSFPLAFQIIQLLGALYLSYLAIKIVLAAWKELSHLKKLSDNPDQSLFNQTQIVEYSDLNCFKQGFICNILNPKVLIYCISTIPLFINDSETASLSLFWQFIILAVSQFFLGVFHWGLISYLVNYLANRFATPSFRAKLEVVAGSILFFIGASLLYHVVNLILLGSTELY